MREGKRSIAGLGKLENKNKNWDCEKSGPGFLTLL